MNPYLRIKSSVPYLAYIYNLQVLGNNTLSNPYPWPEVQGLPADEPSLKSSLVSSWSREHVEGRYLLWVDGFEVYGKSFYKELVKDKLGRLHWNFLGWGNATWGVSGMNINALLDEDGYKDWAAELENTKRAQWMSSTGMDLALIPDLKFLSILEAEPQLTVSFSVPNYFWKFPVTYAVYDNAVGGRIPVYTIPSSGSGHGPQHLTYYINPIEAAEIAYDSWLYQVQKRYNPSGDDLSLLPRSVHVQEFAKTLADVVAAIPSRKLAEN